MMENAVNASSCCFSLYSSRDASCEASNQEIVSFTALSNLDKELRRWYA